jgi:hypothetical protein
MEMYLSLTESDPRLDRAFPALGHQTLRIDTRSTTLLDALDCRCMANATALPARALSNTPSN